jgi:small subunit ribosomal protein S6
VRDYEAVYIFDSSLDEAKINEKLDRFHGLLTGDGGQITAVDQWGKRPLAYPIEDRDNGHYVVSQFTTDTTKLPEFERILKLDEDLLRYLVVINEGDLTTSPFAHAPESGEGEGDDDEE